MPPRYREIEVRGRPRQLGRELGEAAREEIRAFAAIALERVNISMRVAPESAMAVAQSCIPYVEAYAPDLLAEMSGMAEGSGVPLERLMLLQTRNQLRPEGGCTAFSLNGQVTATQQRLIGQNWDNDPALDPFTVVLIRRPDGKPAMMDVTQAGLIAYIGVNDAGMGLCLNTLPAPSRNRGVPHYFMVRRIYESTSLQGAVRVVEQAERAIPANIVLSTPEGAADLEVTIDAVHVLTAAAEGWLTHTNHCLHPQLKHINREFPELIQSQPRKTRMDKLLGQLDRPVLLSGLKQALRDHEGYPYSICRHPNQPPGDGFWSSVFSIIAEPEAGRLHVSRGNPCTAPYETYELH